jgi:hypothetical protein
MDPCNGAGAWKVPREAASGLPVRRRIGAKIAAMLRRAVTTAVALLALFHLWLFAGQMWDGRALEPATALRWLVAGGLVVALAGLRRTGQPLVFGRRAAAIWLLAALLHAPKALDRIQDLPPDTWIEVVSVGLAAAGAGLALLAVVAACRVRRRRGPGVAFLTLRPLAIGISPGFALACAARPPPIR